MTDVHIAAVAIKVELAGNLLHGDASAIVFQFGIDLPGEMDSQIHRAPSVPVTPVVEELAWIVHPHHAMMIVTLEQDLRFSHPSVTVGSISVEHLVRLDHNLVLIPALHPKVSASVFDQDRSARAER